MVPSKFVKLLPYKEVFLVLAFKLELFHEDILFVSFTTPLDIIKIRYDIAFVGIFVMTW